ncbi:complement C1q-like protein 2 [Pecten maximus]|uniref:complement C1q-like protein 2 n=1 Tax=Pecten maximus TaxID=6579 RepID=UPI001457EA72|nr:complement C1q-like protein 2 [Pecten maximus]
MLIYVFKTEYSYFNQAVMCSLILIFLTSLVTQTRSDGVHDKDQDLEYLKLKVEQLSVLSQENHQKIQRLENLYTRERNERLSLEKSLSDLQYSHHRTATTLARDTRTGHMPVFAFHAILSSDFIASQDNEVVPFDFVSADYPTRHIHYNTTTGKYTCLLEGFYFFSWATGATGQGSSAETSLVKNGDWIGMQVAYDSYASSSSSVILHLDNHDTVWVRMKTKGSSVLRDVSTFTAFRLSD